MTGNMKEPLCSNRMGSVVSLSLLLTGDRNLENGMILAN